MGGREKRQKRDSGTGWQGLPHCIFSSSRSPDFPLLDNPWFYRSAHIPSSFRSSRTAPVLPGPLLPSLPTSLSAQQVSHLSDCEPLRDLSWPTAQLLNSGKTSYMHSRPQGRKELIHPLEEKN